MPSKMISGALGAPGRIVVMSSDGSTVLKNAVLPSGNYQLSDLGADEGIAFAVNTTTGELQGYGGVTFADTLSGTESLEKTVTYLKDKYYYEIIGYEDQFRGFSDEGYTGHYKPGVDAYSCDLFFQFDDVTIPAGAIITSATLILYENNTGGFPVDFEIFAKDDANPTFPADTTEAKSVLDNDLTESYVDWEVTESVGFDNAYTSPDVSPLVQSLVNKPGWESGNSMLFIIRDKENPYLKYIRFLDTKWGAYNHYKLNVEYRYNS